MADEFLGIYLNDHLAGSLVALELLQHLERAYSGRPVERFAADLRADIENEPSQRVAEKAGFVREGVLRSSLVHKGERRDVIMYSLVREDL